MKLKRLVAIAAASLTLLSPAVEAAETLRAAVLQSGTVNWELDTIRHYGLDEKNGFRLEVAGMAGNPATRIAFQGGEADIVVADWIWVARQRAAGRDYVFIPYSRSVGDLLVDPDKGFDDLTDLKGAKIGIAGGPVDKSWLIMRAYAQQKYGFDLLAETEQVFGAPPLIMKAALSGEVDAGINFWHFAAKMKTKGLTSLVSVSEAAEALGLDPQMPLLGYVVKGDMLRDKPDLVAGLAAASRAAKEKLANDPTAWERIRPLMRAKADAEFEALKEGFIAGIPAPGAVDRQAAAKVLEVMSELGGAELVGEATSLPEGVFVSFGN
ncbi:ABC transporter substrate-binding protein [Notoacmeibacter marinus]|nr:ABC transporter substrate-binding protein [Notoacmeibacter marinus]